MKSGFRGILIVVLVVIVPLYLFSPIITVLLFRRGGKQRLSQVENQLQRED